MRALIHSIYDVEIADGKLPAIKCSKRRVARNRMTARHLGKRLDGIKDAPCETGCTTTGSPYAKAITSDISEMSRSADSATLTA